MKNSRSVLLAATFVATSLLVTSCKKHKHEHEKVNITIQSPAAGASVSNPFLLHVDFSSEEEIHDVAVVIKKVGTAGDPIAYQFFDHIHAKTFTLKDSLVIPVSQSTEMRLEVKAGEGEHESEATRSFILLP